MGLSPDALVLALILGGILIAWRVSEWHRRRTAARAEPDPHPRRPHRTYH